MADDDKEPKNALTANEQMGPFALAIQKWKELSRLEGWSEGSFFSKVYWGGSTASFKADHTPTNSDLQELFEALGAADTGFVNQSGTFIPAGRAKRQNDIRESHANRVVEEVARDLGWYPEWEDSSAPSRETILVTPREWMQKNFTSAESFFPPRYSSELPVKIPVYEDLVKLYASATGLPPSDAEIDSLRAYFWRQFEVGFSASSLKELREVGLRLDEKVTRNDTFKQIIGVVSQIPADWIADPTKDLSDLTLWDVEKTGVNEIADLAAAAAASAASDNERWLDAYKVLNGVSEVPVGARNLMRQVQRDMKDGRRISREYINPDVYKVAIRFGLKPELWNKSRMEFEINTQMGKLFATGQLPPRAMMALRESDTMTAIVDSLNDLAFTNPDWLSLSPSEVVQRNLSSLAQDIRAVVGDSFRGEAEKSFDEMLEQQKARDPYGEHTEEFTALARQRAQIVNGVLIARLRHEQQQDKLYEQAREAQIGEREATGFTENIPLDFKRAGFDLQPSLSAEMSSAVGPIREFYITKAAVVQAEKDRKDAATLAQARNMAAAQLSQLGGNIGVQNLQEVVQAQMKAAGGNLLDSNLNVMRLLDEFIRPEAAIESITGSLKEGDKGFDAIQVILGDQKARAETPGKAALDASSRGIINTAQKEIDALEKKRGQLKSDPLNEDLTEGEFGTEEEIDARQLELRTEIANAGISGFPDRPDEFSITQRLFDKDGKDVTEQLALQAKVLREQQFTQIDFEALLAGVPEEDQAATRQFLLSNFGDLRNEFNQSFQTGDGRMVQDFKDIDAATGGIPDEDDDSPGAFSRRTLGLQAQGEARLRATQRARASSPINFQQFAAANLPAFVKKQKAKQAAELVAFKGSRVVTGGRSSRRVRF